MLYFFVFPLVNPLHFSMQLYIILQSPPLLHLLLLLHLQRMSTRQGVHLSFVLSVIIKHSLLTTQRHISHILLVLIALTILHLILDPPIHNHHHPLLFRHPLLLLLFPICHPPLHPQIPNLIPLILRIPSVVSNV